MRRERSEDSGKTKKKHNSSNVGEGNEQGYQSYNKINVKKRTHSSEYTVNSFLN